MFMDRFSICGILLLTVAKLSRDLFFQNPFSDQQFLNKEGPEAAKRTSSSSGAASNMKKASSTTNIDDQLYSIFGGYYHLFSHSFT